MYTESITNMIGILHAPPVLRGRHLVSDSAFYTGFSMQAEVPEQALNMMPLGLGVV